MAPPSSDQALKLALDRLAPGSDVLDVGAGDGKHSRAFMEAGHDVTAVDLRPAPGWWPLLRKDGDLGSCWVRDSFPMGRGGWPAGSFVPGYDLVWCSHVLEHLPDVGASLGAMRDALGPDGLLAITVPPRKDAVVGGHRNLFNLGTLAYNLILAGFDCSRASFGAYGYSLSAIVSADRLVPEELLDTLAHDHGDIERLYHCFPPEWNVRQGFDGARVPSVRWG